MELLRLLARQRLLKIGDKGIMTIATKEAVEREANNLALLLQKYKLDPSAFNDIGTLKRTIRGLEELDLAGGLQDLAKKKTDNVFDLEGKKIKDPTNIMGGKEFTEKSIKKNIDEATEKGDFKGIFNQVMRDPEIAEEFKKIKAAQALADERALQTKLIPLDTIQYQGKEIQKMSGPEKQKYLITDDKQTAELLKRGYTFDDIIYAQDNYGLTAKEIMQEAAGATKKDPFPFSTGGRAGYKIGSGIFSKIFQENLKNFKPKNFLERRNFILSLIGQSDDQVNKRMKKQIEETIKKTRENPEFEFPKPGDKEYDDAMLKIESILARDKTKNADGGRIGLKVGSKMSKRAFLKLLAALGITGAAAKSGIVSLGGKQTGKQVVKEVIKTPNVAGKPEWFDKLINKVVLEGDDVTKNFATKERQIVHTKKIDEDSTVRVTQDLDEGSITVDYDSADNVFGDTVQLRYKKPLPDEGDPRPSAEFTTAESGPVGRRYGPDDYEIEIDEVGGSSIKDLDSDVSKLKEFATGKKPTIKEIIQNKKRKDKAQRITEDPEAQSDAVVRRQGEVDESDYETLGTGDDFASGGIARMLGE
tara:strand:- start:144 stop:1907 length:1764 start_codon:yes stop_codon:yes gene_type:complete